MSVRVAGSLLHGAVIVLLLALAPQLSAQSWDDLRGLHSGDHVKVLEMSGQEHKGEFRSVSTSAITILTSTGENTVERAQIKRVQVPSAARRVRNAIIGAAIGVAAGVTVDQTLGVRLRNEGNSTGRALMYVGPIALFGGISAALPAYRTVYRVH